MGTPAATRVGAGTPKVPGATTCAEVIVVLGSLIAARLSQLMAGAPAVSTRAVWNRNAEMSAVANAAAVRLRDQVDSAGTFMRRNLLQQQARRILTGFGPE